jgi:hypothetical protein
MPGYKYVIMNWPQGINADYGKWKLSLSKYKHTIELIWFGKYNCFAQASIVLVFPVPGGP